MDSETAGAQGEDAATGGSGGADGGGVDRAALEQAALGAAAGVKGCAPALFVNAGVELCRDAVAEQPW